MIEVILTFEERVYSIGVGLRREAHANHRGYVTHFGLDDLDRHPRGALGEKACANHYDLPWDGRSTQLDKHLGDLVTRSGRKIEVRTSRYPDPCPPLAVWRHVFCHDIYETKLYLFALANLDIATVTILGWCEGAEIKVIGEWSDEIPYPAWVIPVSKMRELTKFPQ